MNPVSVVTWAFTAGILALFTWLGVLDLRDRRIKRRSLGDLHDVFPDDTEPWPGCQCTVRWDNNADRAVWTTCGQCAQPVGKHAAPWSGGSLDNQQPEVILAVVTDVQKRRQQ